MEFKVGGRFFGSWSRRWWAFYASQYYLSKGKWVGGGGSEIRAFLGLMLGSKGLIMTLVIAYIVVAIALVLLVLLKKKTMQSHLPMAIFLAPAAFIAMLYGTKILSWYLGFFVW